MISKFTNKEEYELGKREGALEELERLVRLDKKLSKRDYDFTNRWAGLMNKIEKRLKEFWDFAEDDAHIYAGIENPVDEVKALRLKQGQFFWGRGGKGFVKPSVSFNYLDDNFEFLIKSAKIEGTLEARDFLDCLDCLGEEKVKELIKGVKKI